MNVRRLRSIAMVYGCAAALIVAGCASPAGGTNAQSLPGTSPSIGNAAASVTNLAGEYRGKFLIQSKRVGDIDFDLTQDGTSIGGFLELVLSSRTLQEPVAMTLDTANNTVIGSAIDPSGKTTCAYSLKGSYNPKTFVLRGTSSPATCSGKTATFVATETCFYNTGSSANVRRPRAHGIIEC